MQSKRGLMSKSFGVVRIIKIVLITAIVLFIGNQFIFWNSLNQAASIGIIGGVDGPTAVFVTSRFLPSILKFAVIVAVVIVVLVKIKKRAL